MFGLGTPEILAILVVLLLLFGSRLPSIMRGMGKSVTEFKKGMNDITDEVTKEPQKDEAPPSAEDKSDDAPPAG